MRELNCSSDVQALVLAIENGPCYKGIHNMLECFVASRAASITGERSGLCVEHFGAYREYVKVNVSIFGISQCRLKVQNVLRFSYNMHMFV